MTATVLDLLVERIRSVARVNGDVTAPVAVLWPDQDQQWARVMHQIAVRYPVLTLGEYAPSANTGPAYWIRYQLGMVSHNAEDSPIVYLPGVSQDDLRASDDCPETLRPIVELQYRGVVWRQPNSKDWTPTAFLKNRDRGLGIELAPSAATSDALSLTFDEVLRQPIEWLVAKQPLTNELLLSLVQPDPVRSLLEWLSDPSQAEGWNTAERSAFKETCRADYGFDPETDGPIEAARLLARRDGRWKQVWSRFREVPQKYPGIKDALRSAGNEPEQLQISEEAGWSDVWPQDTERAEADLRKGLEAVLDLPASNARKRIIELENAHGHRRLWVWSSLGEAPVVSALEHLATLATQTEATPNGSLDDLANWYMETGYRADDASLRALANVQSVPDLDLVRKVVRHIYLGWLDDSCRSFQDTYRIDPDQYQRFEPAAPEPGTCQIFSDGLRYDLGVRLAELLRGLGLRVELEWHFAALPTITATAKPALTPVAAEFGSGPELGPTVLATGTEVQSPQLHKALEKAGYQVLSRYETGDPTGLGWSEEANIDGLGHDRKANLAAAVDGELGALASRIEMLLAAGWQSVEVLTDHGFLHVPGGLPKVELPAHLVAKRKGRCARTGENGDTGGHPAVQWAWDSNIRFAVATGAGCFEDGKEYEHGGLSPQECVVPRLLVSRDETAAHVKITSLSWAGLRVRVEVEGPAARADVRTKPADPNSSLVGGGFELKDGSGAAPVPKPDAEGLSAVVVVMDAEGRLLDQRGTLIGES